MSQESSNQELKDRLDQMERKNVWLLRLVMCCLAANVVAIVGFKLPVAPTAQAAPPATSPEMDKKAELLNEQRLKDVSAIMDSMAFKQFQESQWKQHKLNGASGVQEASEFRVVDKSGRTRAILGLDPSNKVRLLMYDASGKELLSGPGENRIMPAR